MKITIKPEDLVRTPAGELAIVESINADGSRDVRRICDGELVSLMPANIFLVRASIPRPWPKRTL